MTDLNLTPAAWLDLIASKAVGLRQAGVLEFELAGCKVKLAPAEVEQPEQAEEPTPTYDGDPLSDPGLYPNLNGRVPGFARLHGDDQ